MLKLILGAYVVGALFEFFITFFILVFFTFRPGVGIISGAKEACAALVAFAFSALVMAVIWPSTTPILACIVYCDLRAQERKENAKEGRQGDGD